MGTSRGILAAGVVFLGGLTAWGAEEPAARPDRYVLDYPAAQQFCPPVVSYFDDVSQAIEQVGGRTIRHQLNGGYGLPVADMVDGKHLLHLGADVAWYGAGQPVYAIAAGVVRVSQGPPPTGPGEKRRP